MKPLNNSLINNHPTDSCPVFYDSYSQKFFSIKDGQLYEIYQESNENFNEYEADVIRGLVDQLPVDKIMEMVLDWEREKYPERFL